MYIPTRNRKKAYILIGTLTATVLLLSVLCAFFPSYVAYFTALEVVILVVFAMVTKRFILDNYVYGCDGDRFSIIKSGLDGKGRKVFDRPVSTVKSVLVKSEFDRVKKKIKAGATSFEYFDYCPDLVPNDAFVVTFEYDGNVSAITLQISNRYAETLKSFIK